MAIGLEGDCGDAAVTGLEGGCGGGCSGNCSADCSGNDVAGPSGSSSSPLLPTPPAAQTIERAQSNDQSSTNNTLEGVSGASSAVAAGSDRKAGGDVLAGRGVKPPRAGTERSVAVEAVAEAPRLNGKSVQAKGSTGVSPMQKRNRRELKVRVPTEMRYCERYAFR